MVVCDLARKELDQCKMYLKCEPEVIVRPRHRSYGRKSGKVPHEFGPVGWMSACLRHMRHSHFDPTTKI